MKWPRINRPSIWLGRRRIMGNWHHNPKGTTSNASLTRKAAKDAKRDIRVADTKKSGGGKSDKRR